MELLNILYSLTYYSCMIPPSTTTVWSQGPAKSMRIFLLIPVMKCVLMYYSNEDNKCNTRNLQSINPENMVIQHHALFHTEWWIDHFALHFVYSWHGYIKITTKKGQFVRLICQDIEIDKLYRNTIHFHDPYHFPRFLLPRKGLFLTICIQ